ncbi:MAG: hypothetical protein RR382_00750 [Tannerellaceae bacterium]
MVGYGLTVAEGVPWVDTVKEALEEESGIEIRFTEVYDWNTLRRELYHNFRGFDVTIKRVDNDDRKVLIVNEKIRTSDPIIAQSEAEKKSVVKMSDFFIVSRRCQCCGEMKPEEKFGKRHYGGKTYRQSYCRDCQRLYSHWRGSFLKEHKADKLTPRYTLGRRQRNELFHNWYAEFKEVSNG